MKEIKILVPESFFLPVDETISFDELPFGKREKALRLLKRSLLSMKDNNSNYLKWKVIIRKIREKRKEERSYYHKRWEIKKELVSLNILIKKYALKDTQGAYLKMKYEHDQYEQLEDIKMKEIERLKKELPKFLRSGNGWLTF
jgi:hypothetical protein